jgi:hypothetical protein
VPIIDFDDEAVRAELKESAMTNAKFRAARQGQVLDDDVLAAVQYGIMCMEIAIREKLVRLEHEQ